MGQLQKLILTFLILDCLQTTASDNVLVVPPPPVNADNFLTKLECKLCHRNNVTVSSATALLLFLYILRAYNVDHISKLNPREQF